MYLVLAYIFGTAETKDDTADRAEDDQHKTHADAMTKCFGKLKGLYNVQDNSDNAADADNDRLPHGSAFSGRHNTGDNGCYHEEQAIESAPADVIFHISVKNRNDRHPAGPVRLAEDFPVRNNLKDEPYQLKDQDSG